MSRVGFKLYHVGKRGHFVKHMADDEKLVHFNLLMPFAIICRWGTNAALLLMTLFRQNDYWFIKNEFIHPTNAFEIVIFFRHYTRMSSNGNIFRVTGPLWGDHQSRVDSPNKDQWRWALMFSLTCSWTNGWANNRDAGDFRRNRALIMTSL